MPPPAALAPFVDADIYLLDHILRGHVRSGMRVLDVGCGGGRNLPALLASGCLVTGIDHDGTALRRAHERCAGTRDAVPAPALVQCDLDGMPLAAASFAVVLVNAVLHFAPDAAAFHRWADACWRQLAPGGLFLARLSTRIGLPDARPPGFTYLAREEDLIACEARWRARRRDPLKTTLVERTRTMTTWALTR
jgi:SAM-dependent methyltransferase